MGNPFMKLKTASKTLSLSHLLLRWNPKFGRIQHQSVTFEVPWKLGYKNPYPSIVQTDFKIVMAEV